MTKTLIIIGGPTAIGKTALAIKLAKQFQSEIISADARQFYKELNIGVAKPSKKELHQITHHFIGHKSIKDSYSIGQYEKEGLLLLNQLFTKHNLLFVCGGSGLYIDALCEGLHDFPKIDDHIKQKLIQELQEKGLQRLIQELHDVDFKTYQKIDKKNPRRIIRALEIYRSSGKPYSFYIQKKRKQRNFNTIFINLNTSRDILYQKINNRVDNMIAKGLIQETKTLYQYRENHALNTIGYQELFEYFNQNLSLSEAIDEIKKNTRRYAKRQITWFKKEKYHQVNINEEEKIFKIIQDQSI